MEKLVFKYGPLIASVQFYIWHRLHNKSGYKQKNVQCSSSWSSLAGAGSLLDWNSQFTVSPNPHNPSIDRTPLCLHMTSILPALWIGFKSWIMQHAAKVQSCVCAELQSGTLYFLCSWAIGTLAQLSSKQSIIHDWTHWSQGVIGIYQWYIQCLQCESVCLSNRLSNNLIIIFTTH